MKKLPIIVAFCVFCAMGVHAEPVPYYGKRDASKLIKPPKEYKIIIDTNKQQTIQQLKNQYNKKRTIDLAQTISEEYFNLNDHKNSLIWALRANDIDPKSEFAWIMYAKNQVRLGDKDKAIRVLEIYIDHFKKADASRTLLEAIKKGEYQ
jgi:tetratricopeptide (TPR) repeat protein